MSSVLQILSNNYNGQSVDITFYPCSGGIINIGTVTLPYDYYSDDFTGLYSIYIPFYDKTCEVDVPCTSTLYITDELGNPLISENGFYIIVE
jgi:hypothetical protein